MLFFLIFWSFSSFLGIFFKFFGKKPNFGPNFWGNLKFFKTTHNLGVRNYKDFSKKYTPMAEWWLSGSYKKFGGIFTHCFNFFFCFLQIHFYFIREAFTKKKHWNFPMLGGGTLLTLLFSVAVVSLLVKQIVKTSLNQFSL